MDQLPGADASLVKPVEEDILLETLHSLVQGEAMSDAACLLLTEDEASTPADARHLVLCPGAVTCTPEEVWKHLAAGFRGIVFVPVALAGDIDFERFARHREVQVVILPSVAEMA